MLSALIYIIMRWTKTKSSKKKQIGQSKKWKETHNYVSCFSLHFFYALVTSNVLYNRTELSQRFSFLFRKRYEIFNNIEKC